METTYKVRVYFSSENGADFFKGNISLYYIHHVRGKHISLCGVTNAKSYTTQANADRLADKVYDLCKGDCVVEVMEYYTNSAKSVKVLKPKCW